MAGKADSKAAADEADLVAKKLFFTVLGGFIVFTGIVIIFILR